jgi:hypothetical protein
MVSFYGNYLEWNEIMGSDVFLEKNPQKKTFSF